MNLNEKEVNKIVKQCPVNEFKKCFERSDGKCEFEGVVSGKIIELTENGMRTRYLFNDLTMRYKVENETIEKHVEHIYVYDPVVFDTFEVKSHNRVSFTGRIELIEIEEGNYQLGIGHVALAFIELEKYGKLYVDRILFESYCPVIFTCVNASNEIFICVCCRRDKAGCKWLIGKTTRENIIKTLQDEITMRQLLLEYSSGRITLDRVDSKYVISYNNSDWNEDSPYLPQPDSYMYAEDGEFDDEIAYFASMDEN